MGSVVRMSLNEGWRAVPVVVAVEAGWRVCVAAAAVGVEIEVEEGLYRRDMVLARDGSHSSA